MLWETISVLELETEHASCDCCTTVTKQATGELTHNGDFIGWYTVLYSEEFTAHPPTITVYVGDWGEEASVETRWGTRVSWHADGCTLLDWDTETKKDLTLFTPLDRDEVVGSNFAHELWAMVDAVIMKDSRLKELHS